MLTETNMAVKRASPNPPNTTSIKGTFVYMKVQWSNNNSNNNNNNNNNKSNNNNDK